MKVQPAVILDDPHLPELIHEKADSGASGADHLRQGFLADFGDNSLWFAFFAEMGQQQKHPRQPLLTRIEKLIYQILLNPDVAREHIGEEYLGKGRLFVEHADRR